MTSRTSALPHPKLDPARFVNLSPQMAPTLGFVLEREFTIPALAGSVVMPDGHALARSGGEVGPLARLGAEAGLRAGLCRLGKTAGPDDPK